jgi:hypothetical protein
MTLMCSQAEVYFTTPLLISAGWVVELTTRHEVLCGIYFSSASPGARVGVDNDEVASGGVNISTCSHDGA